MPWRSLGKAKRRTPESDNFCVYTLRNDKVIGIKAFHTRDEAVEAAGLSE